MFVDEKPQGEVTAPVLEPWRQLLLAAADVMDKRGKCTGAYEGTFNQVCFYGALNTAQGRWASHDLNSLALETATWFRDFVDIEPYVFSDQHTKDEVVAAMRACARS